MYQKLCFDIAYGENRDLEDTKEEKQRLNRIYVNGVKALRAVINIDEIKSSLSENYLIVNSASKDRDDYIAHPSSGETLSEQGKHDIQLKIVNSSHKVLFVISDGLNANAINEHIPSILPKVKQNLKILGISYHQTDIVVINGRVRLGYQIGDLSQCAMVVHFIGERPGTGLDQMSVYITYGIGKWNQQMEHCLTTVICGIHPKGKKIEEEIEEITNVIKHGLKFKATGVALSKLLD